MQDVADLNETKRTAVLTRLLSLVMMIYLLTQAVLFTIYSTPKVALLPFLMMCAFALTVYTSYHDMTDRARKMCIWYMYIWSIVIVSLVGWGVTGAQNFLFVLLLFAFMTSYENVYKKLMIPVFLCVSRLLVFIFTSRFGPIVKVRTGGETFFQLSSSTAMFAISTLLVMYFSQHALEMEQKLISHNREIEAIAEHDTLTGLFNRRAIQGHINNELAEFSKNKKGLCIAIGDLDEFKMVNDMYGHDAGDLVLKKVAEIFETFMNGNGYVARWGGEEFIFVFTHNHKEVCAEKLEMLRKTIMLSEVNYGEHEIRVTMTFGLAEYEAGMDINEVLIIADKRLYRGKSSGRNQVVS